MFRCVGWLRKDTIWKAHAPPSVTISPFIGLFEPFVSLTIRLYQSSSSYSLQTAVCFFQSPLMDKSCLNILLIVFSDPYLFVYAAKEVCPLMSGEGSEACVLRACIFSQDLYTVMFLPFCSGMGLGNVLAI